MYKRVYLFKYILKAVQITFLINELVCHIQYSMLNCICNLLILILFHLGGVKTGFSAIHWHQRHHVLCSGFVQHAGICEWCFPLLCCDHWCCQCRGDTGINLFSGQTRTPNPVVGSRGSDAHLSGVDSNYTGNQGEGPLQWPHKGFCSAGGCAGVHLCGCICVVMGPSWVVDIQWDIPTGDSLSRPEYNSLCQLDLHLHHCTGLHLHAVPLQVWHLLVLLRVDLDHVHVCALLAPRDKECPHWRDDWEGVEAALVVEEVFWRWWLCWRWESSQWQRHKEKWLWSRFSVVN